ncbi:transposase family protein [Waterburya agarophytonicola]|uniref:transposase family protein n=1 Tax=Waterburya agarophytonicola TaxID=2886916 RepID=UPI0021F07632|nr:transposase family protein [Waterburya agarophytonicola]
MNINYAQFSRRVKFYSNSHTYKDQKKYNRELNRLRVAIEHVNRRLKMFKILSFPDRNRHRRFGLRISFIAGIYNYELA